MAQSGGAIGSIFAAWGTGQFEVVYCQEIFEELNKALEYPKLKTRIKDREKNYLLQKIRLTSFCKITSDQKICRDPKDDIYINLCLSSEAVYLISGDKDLLELEHSFDFKIVAPAEFRQLLGC